MYPAFFWFPEDEMYQDYSAHTSYFDDDYEEHYSSTGHLAPAYGPWQTPWHTFPQGRFRLQRVKNMQIIRILHHAMVPTPEISQVVEFGGGTGDVAAMLLDFGYNGTLLLYDYPVIGALIRYWHRYSGVPSIYGHDLHPSPEAVRGNTVIEHTFGALASHVDHAIMHQSLFLATYSLSEADQATRDMFWPMVKQFGIIIMAFGATYINIYNQHENLRIENNDDSFMTPLTALINQTHNIISWEIPYLVYKHHYYFVAIRKDLGQVKCVARLNCSPETIHPRIKKTDQLF